VSSWLRGAGFQSERQATRGGSDINNADLIVAILKAAGIKRSFGVSSGIW